LLLAYSWPGNIRQLRNVIHHACVLARSGCIDVGDLPVLREPAGGLMPAGAHQTLAEMNGKLILTTLRDVGGNKTAAALRLGVTVRTLQNKMKKYREREGVPSHGFNTGEKMTPRPIRRRIFASGAERALEMIAAGSVVGLGTGHAATAFILALGERVRAGLQCLASRHPRTRRTSPANWDSADEFGGSGRH